MLWWPKTGQITQHKTLAERLGRDGSTVTGVAAKVSSRRVVPIVGQKRTRTIAPALLTYQRLRVKGTTATLSMS